ncbi:class II aldolase/adducin family protein [Cupriavidus gilardii]|uniref:class II aldolase/adducin family protein n=1 Tax=Cupriavidus gilardii TaxID=82541 RepID=UPI001572A362|nr:class II aldolase/adducin family protein [Cupriavidus gilardii]MCG5262880.1 class II aldolase/adducin family protein [Cupriavidus gilardii]MDF9432803.1 class II aldolase/adducin family protein [Cupriavidus gilardii]NSX05327.1 class II aldolase/adducin family protein [Cupriavidus gilardii]
MSFALQPARATGASANASATASEAERRTRIDLAAAYRLCALAGWDDLIYTHISATVPDEPDHFLINPFGHAFDEIRASDLVKINGRGEVVGDSPHPVNVTGFALHAAVHAARPDAVCVMHLHNTAGVAVSAQADGLLPLSQHAMRFHGRLAYHDYEGLAFTPAEGARLTASLGGHPAMLLRNHGTLTVGRTVAEAYVLMATLIKACEIQLGALAANRVVLPAVEVATRTSAQLDDGGAIEGALEWPSLLRKLDKIDPSYRD